jgi:concanavalin A-like lectin/glucanase superfamily protein/uncharacterized protein DUF2341
MKKLITLLILLVLITPSYSLLQNQLSCESSGFTWLENSNYPATYSFTDDDFGTIPSDWLGISGISGIENYLDDHNKIYRITNFTSPSAFRQTFTSAKNNGIIEYWIRFGQTDKSSLYVIYDESYNEGIHIDYGAGKFYAYNGTTQKTIQNYESNTWYHFKIQFDSTLKKFNVWINGILRANSFSYRSASCVDLSIMYLVYSSTQAIDVAIDAVGYSWDPNYHTGDNLHASCCGDDVIDLRKGLVSEWHFDENNGSVTYDEISSFNGSISGNPQWITGQYGSALDFDGTGDYISVSDNSYFDLIGSDLTISTWFRLDGDMGNDLYWTMFVSKGGWGPGNGYEIGIRDDRKYIDFNIGVDGATYYDSIGLSYDQWYYLVGTFDDATDTIKLYLNGELVDSAIDTDSIIDSTSDFYLGKRGLIGNSPNALELNGVLDEVRIYNRALSSREVEYLYEMSSYAYINYTDIFHNGTIGVDASYCVNNDFYINLDDTKYYCEQNSNTFLTSDWWNPAWKYKKNITINNTGSELTNYQININPQTYNTSGLVASYHFSSESSSIKDYSGNNNYGSLYGSTIALWNLDEGTGTKIYDSTSYSNDASLVNSPTWIDGISGKALNFVRSSSQYVNINSISSDFNSDKGSISLWANLNDYGSGVYETLIVLYANISNRIFIEHYNDDTMRFYYAGGGVYSEIKVDVSSYLGWHQFAISWDTDADMFKAFIDGVQVGSINSLPTFTGLLTESRIGGVIGYSEYFDGAIDEVVIYNKVISEDEVNELFYSQRAKFVEYSEGYEIKGVGLEFDGVDDYVKIADDFSLDAGTGGFSGSAWIKTDTSSSNSYILNRYDNGGNDRFEFRIITGGFTRIYIKDSDASILYRDSSDVVNDGFWHHVAFTWDNAGDLLHLYVDGILSDGSIIGAANTIGTVNPSGILSIGARGTPGDYFLGLMDEVLIYNRALSADEISDLYHERKGRLDYSDLRFVDENDDELSYYFEFDNLVWVKVPELTESLETNITMYYGNPNTISHSNGELTFDFFDDFNDGSIDNSKWSTHSGNGELLERQGFLEFNCIGTQCDWIGTTENGVYIYSNSEFSASNIFETSMFYFNNFDNTHSGLIEFSSNSNFSLWGPFHKHIVEDIDYIQLEGENSGSFTGTSVTVIDESDYGFLKIERSLNSEYFFTPSFSLNYSSGGTRFDWVDDNRIGLFLKTWTTSISATSRFDEVRVRKYASIEPTIIVQEQEYINGNSKGLVAHYTFDQDVDNKTIDNVGKNTGSLFGSTIGLWRFDNPHYSPIDSTSYSNNGGLKGDTVLLMHFDEGTGSSTNDETGYNLDGTLISMESTDWVKGVSGKALILDGVDEYVNIPYSNIPTMNSISVSVWVKPDVSQYKHIVARYVDLTSATQFSLYQANIGLRWYINEGTNGLDLVSYNIFTIGKWTHIVATFDGVTKVRKVYVDGVLNASDTTAYSALNNPTTDLRIGARTAESSLTAFDGTLDEVGIYSKALSDSEVAELYNSQKAEFIDYTDDAMSGSALEFDDLDDVVDFGDSFDDVITGTDAKFTFSAWIKRSSIGNSDVIMGKIADSNCGENQRQTYFHVRSDNALELWVYGALGGGTYESFYGTTTYLTDTNSWYHVVATFDATQTNYIDMFELYVNGVQQSKVSEYNAGSFVSIPDGTAHFFVGQILDSNGDSCSASYDFDGLIDEVAIYNKTLTYDEVIYLYNSTKVQFIEHVNGKIGKGIEFDGVNTYVNISKLNNNMLDSFTISAWAKMTAYDGATDNILVQQRDASGGFQFGYGWGNDYYIRVLTNSGTKSIVYSYSDYNNWHYYVGVFNGTSVLLYIDGNLVKSDSFSLTSMIDTTADFLIGRDYDGANQVFDGFIDEVKIYNNALTVEEILNEYENSVQKYGCCGDDYNLDTFYNGSIGSTNNFCQQGNYFFQTIEQNSIICNYYGFEFLNNSYHYESNESFSKDFEGSDPSGWTVDDSNSSVEVQVINEFQGHKKVVLIESTIPAYGYFRKYFTPSSLDKSSFEFWIFMEPGYTSQMFPVYIAGSGGNIILLQFYPTYINAYGKSSFGLGTFSEGVWHHIKVVANFTSQNASLYVDNNYLGQKSFYNNPVTTINYLGFPTDNRKNKVYIDAIDYSWSEGYYEKRNFYPQTCCGDDELNDNFYNSTINTTKTFCYNGNIINQTIDNNQNLCENYNFNWLTGNKHYPANYSFNNYSNGDVPTELVSFVDVDTIWFNVSDSFNGHSKILNVSYTGNSTGMEISYIGQQPNFNNGTESIEFWLATTNLSRNSLGTDVNAGVVFGLSTQIPTNNVIAIVHDYSNGGKIMLIQNGTSSYDLIPGSYVANKWYHYRIDINMDEGIFDVYQDGNYITTRNIPSQITSIDYLALLSQAGNPADNVYFDAIGATYLDNYFVGKNIIISCCGDDEILDNFYNSTLSCIKGNLCSDDVDYGIDNIYGTTDDNCGCINEESNCLFSQNYNYSGQCSSNTCQVVSPLGSANLEIQRLNYSNLFSNSLSEIKIYVKNTGTGIGVINGINVTGLDINSIDYNPNIWPNQEGLITITTFNPCSIEGIVNNFNFTINYADTELKSLESTSYEILTDNPLSLIFISNHQAYSALQLSPKDEENIQYFVKNNGLSNINLSVNIVHSNSVFSKVITFSGEYYVSEINKMNFDLNPSSQTFFSNQLYGIISGQNGQYTETLQDNNCEHNKLMISYNYNIISQTSLGIRVMVADEKNVFELIIDLFRQIFN